MKYNVLIQSVGGPAGIGFIKSLRSTDYDIKIIGCDADELASGLYLCDSYYVVSKVNVDNIEIYWQELKSIIEKENINFILPSGDSGLLILSKFKNELIDLGVQIFVSSSNVINLCQDKFKFWQHLNTTFNMPNVIPAVFEKPNIGSGSRGVKLIKPAKGNMLWEYLPGNEYTVDVFCDMDSNSMCTSVRSRLGIKSGISVKGAVIEHKLIETESERLCKKLNIQGPCCIQWKEDINGIPKLIECNPRLGGGTYITSLAGANPAQIYLDLAQGKLITKTIPNKITVTRYFEEHII